MPQLPSHPGVPGHQPWKVCHLGRELSEISLPFSRECAQEGEVLWSVVAVPALGAGSHWRRMSVEKETPPPPHTHTGPRRPCPKPKVPASRAPTCICSRVRPWEAGGDGPTPVASEGMHLPPGGPAGAPPHRQPQAQPCGGSRHVLALQGAAPKNGVGGTIWGRASLGWGREGAGGARPRGRAWEGLCLYIYLFINLFIYVFILGCVGSSLLCAGFL